MAESKKSYTVEELEAMLKAEQEKSASLLDSNKELQTQLEESEKTVSSVVSIVSDGKHKYQLLAKKCQIGDKVYTADDLKKDKEAVAHLVKIGSGLLRKA